MVVVDLYTGDDYAFDLLVSDVPSGQTVVSGWLTIKRFDDDEDASAVISRNIGTTLTSVGQITTSGIYTRLYFIIPRTQTRLLHEDGEYPYSIKALTSADFAKTVDQGTITPVNGVKDGP